MSKGVLVNRLVDLQHASGHLGTLAKGFREAKHERESKIVEEFRAWLWEYKDLFDGQYRKSKSATLVRAQMGAHLKDWEENPVTPKHPLVKE